MRIFADSCVHADLTLFPAKSGFKVEKAIDKGLKDASDEEYLIMY